MLRNNIFPTILLSNNLLNVTQAICLDVILKPTCEKTITVLLVWSAVGTSLTGSRMQTVETMQHVKN